MLIISGKLKILFKVNIPGIRTVIVVSAFAGITDMLVTMWFNGS
jgi:aspartokinase